ncbi:amine sulfotransferase-like isoform X1 [Lepisosteus oculatus]|uniref:Sulfotransferase n=1 Tax=Lepisosteus oculatus TaxID=7918 RepID=W5NKJ8_LEPOC|nr:PREDICTED: amine sulfotransferase-like isoform X1 [Lepisosteus oculatus]
MAESENQMLDYTLVPYKNFLLISNIHSAEDLDQLQKCEIRDSDIFVVTYPKSGTIWMQQILTLIEAGGDLSATQNQTTSDRIPWIELKGKVHDFVAAPSPRIRVSHLPYNILPEALRQKKGKVIYVARNPKDILVSYYHFHSYAVMLETPKNFEDFFDKFLEGRVFGSSWFDQIKEWYSHKDEMNFLYLTYEEMIKDIKTSVLKICKFLGKQLNDEQINNVVEHSTFKNMKVNPKANYQLVSNDLLNQRKGAFMRKGTIGDWKNYFTVAQNEKFDKIFQEKMKDFPLTFVWDICD